MGDVSYQQSLFHQQYSFCVHPILTEDATQTSVETRWGNRRFEMLIEGKNLPMILGVISAKR